MSLKITSVQASGTWDGPSGQLHVIEISLDDGTTGEVMAKTPDRWKVGDEVEVKSKKETQYGVKLKLDRAGYGMGASGEPSGSGYLAGPSDKQKQIAAQWAINAAIASLMPSEGLALIVVEDRAKQLLEMRDRLVA